jgi:hydroxypyruvate isomerase
MGVDMEKQPLDQPTTPSPSSLTTRRGLFGTALAAAGGATLAGMTGARAADPAALKGNIKHSVVFWCFNVAGDKWDIEKACEVTKSLGGTSVELVGPDVWPVLKKHGLTCAIAPNGMPGAPFMKGLNNPAYQTGVVDLTKKAISDSAAFGCSNVIAFNGFKWQDAEDPSSGEISLEDGAKNTVEGLKKLAKHAEENKVTVCLEQLNTRDETHPMKGHPGYQGDDIDYCADIIKAVGSPNVKLLFDIYHVQAMNGDIIRRLDQYKELIGHIHTAGNPGRGELDDRQEINYPPIMDKLVELGYEGFVGHEFIPTRDAAAGLSEAITLCDV